MAYTNIDDPSAYFQATLYTGTGSSQSITNNGNSDMQPDLWWQINRDLGRGTYVADSSRGVSKYLYTFLDYAEATASNYVTSFDSDGFTLGNGDTAVNNNAQGFVTWQWKANGGTTTSVSASGTGTASINASTHQVNQDAGFSIITYTGRDDEISNGEETKLTHGLGVKPDFTIMKKRDGTGGWIVMGKNVSVANPYSYNEHLILDTTAALNAVTYTGNAYPDSTYIYLGKALMNDVGDDYVCYAFAEKQGYSKFGKYEGNGNANGPFVYTGFKPAFVIIKNIDNGGYDWAIMDSKRTPTNANGTYEFLWANLSGAEFTDGDSGINMEIDFLSNGFKIRTARPELNLASTFIYMAFAENPFVTSTGIPTTAR